MHPKEILQSYTAGERNFPKCRFEKINMYQINLTNANLTNSQWSECNIEDCNFYQVNLSQAKIGDSQIRNVDLKSVNLNEAHLYRTSIEYSDLSNTNLSNANINIIISSNLENANLKNISINRLQKSNLRNANLTNSKIKYFIETDLTGANLSNADLTLTEFVKSILYDTNFTKAKSPLIEALERIEFGIEFYPGLTRKEIDATTKDLSFTLPEELYELYQWHNGTKERNVWNKCFVSTKEFVTLQEAINYSVNLADSYSFGERFKPNWFYAFAEGTDNSYAYVVVLGEEMATVLDFCPDTASVRISYSSITQMMLEKAFEQKVDFSGANLAGVDLNGFDLRFSKLSGSNLLGANLSQANLEGADLSGACLTHVNLKSAVITNVNFTNTIFYQTIMPDGSIRDF